MPTLCEEFHYVYFLFHDESGDKRVWESVGNKTEQFVIGKLWNEFNVFIRFVKPYLALAAERKKAALA